MIKNALLVLAPIVFGAQPVLAHPGEQAAPESTSVKAESAAAGDEVLAPPPTYKGNDVKVDEKLGAKIPVDAKFANST